HAEVDLLLDLTIPAQAHETRSVGGVVCPVDTPAATLVLDERVLDRRHAVERDQLKGVGIQPGDRVHAVGPGWGALELPGRQAVDFGAHPGEWEASCFVDDPSGDLTGTGPCRRTSEDAGQYERTERRSHGSPSRSRTVRRSTRSCQE